MALMDGDANDCVVEGVWAPTVSRLVVVASLPPVKPETVGEMWISVVCFGGLCEKRLTGRDAEVGRWCRRC